MTPQVRSQLQISDPNLRGVVDANVDQSSDAGQRGLRPGDLILSVNQTAAASPEAVAAAVEAARRAGRDTVLLLVRRGNAPAIYVPVELAQASASR